MADDLSLLFRLRAQNQAGPVIKGLQNDIQKLRQSTTSDFTQINQIATSSLSRITQSITSVASGVPVLGSAVNALTGEMGSLAAGTGTAAGALTGMLGPLGIAAAGFIATAVAVEQLSVALFESAKSAADYQGKLLDLSQQTGVAVETLSALEIAAAGAGGNIDSVAASLGIFQKNMVEADDATSKAHKAFASLGVIVSDTQTTLEDTFKALAQLPEGFRQTNTAMELFGNRGGRQVLAIIKETNGNLPLLIERLRDAGLVTTQQAQKADEFDESLKGVNFQLRGLGTEVIPVATDAIKDLSKFLKENKEAIDSVKTGLGALAFFLVTPFRGALLLAAEGVNSFNRTLELLHLKAKEPIVVDITVKPKVSSEDADLLRQMKLLDVTKPLDKPKTTGTRRGSEVDVGAQLVKSLSSELENLTERTRVQEVAAELLDKKYSKLNSTIRAQVIAIAGEIDLKKLQIQNEKDLAKAKEDQARETERQRAEGLSFIDSQTQQINKLKGVTVSAFDAATAALSLFGEALSDAERALITANARTIQLLKNAETLQEALHNIDLTPGASDLDALQKSLGETAKSGNILSDEQINALGTLPDAIQPAFDSIKALKGVYLDAAGAIADGTASMVEQWVLLGNVGPQAIRKMTAQILAGLAAQAAAKAIFELAEGFGALAGFLPGPAALHFKAAAFYGIVAGTAGAAGRAIAGNVFQPQQGRSGSFAQGQLNPLNLQRNQPEPTRTIVLQVQSNDSHIVKVVGANIREAGDLREIIFNDGVS